MKNLRIAIISLYLLVSCSMIFAQYAGNGPIGILNDPGHNMQDLDNYQPPKSSILLANDFIFSISATYEGIIRMVESFHLALRGGPAITLESGTDLALVGQLSILAGKSVHFMEAGLAYHHTLTYPDAYVLPLLGYRYMGKKGLSFKLYGDLKMDIIDSEEFGFLNAGVHISIGYRFRL